MNTQLSGGLTESLLQVNQLSYRLPPQISIASKCTHVINYSQQSAYVGGNTMIFDIQTGSAFVDPQASYFRFIVKPKDNTHSFGSGSVGNIFTRVVVRTATGKELSRVEDANLLIKMTDVWQNSYDWKSTAGSAQGYSQITPLALTTTTYAAAIPATGRLFIIPFQTVMPCMSPHGAKLVPPNLMSGLRIELTLAGADDAFCSSNQGTLGSLESYEVLNVEAHLKTHELADAFQRKIQEMSVQGLNYLYKEHFHTIVSPGTGSSNINFDVKKACSKALTARIVSRLSTDLTTVGKDRMASHKYTYTSHQAKIGSDYFPNAPLAITGTPSANNVNEAYYYALYAQDKLDKWNPAGVSTTEYLGAVPTGGVNDVYSSGVISYNFNKSNVSDMAGYTISNSRALLVDLIQDTAENVRLDVYLTFLRLAKVYQSNCVVLD